MTTPPTDDLRARHVEVLREVVRAAKAAQSRLNGLMSGKLADLSHDEFIALQSALTHADAAIAALSALPAAGGEVTEWRWVDERGRAMTSWKQGDPPPMTAVSDTKGTMSVEVRTTPQPSAAEGVIAAAEAYASNYNDDDRQDIKADVMNAFFAGSQYKDAAVGAQGLPSDELIASLESREALRALARTLRDECHRLATPAAGKGVDDASERQPDGYAYRYEDGFIRHNGGRDHNGMRPTETIPFYYGSAPALTRQPVAGDGMVLVPRVATNAMQIAGLAALDDSDATPDSIGHLIGYKAVREAYAAMLAAAPTGPAQGGGWIAVSDRLPDDGALVMVYAPQDGGRIDFDGREEGVWVEHYNAYEHFIAVGGSGAAGPDCVCVGPSEDAPYTHWQPMPAAPAATPTDGGEG